MLKSGDRVKIIPRMSDHHPLEFQIGTVVSSDKHFSLIRFGFNSVIEVSNDILFSVESRGNG